MEVEADITFNKVDRNGIPTKVGIPQVTGSTIMKTKELVSILEDLDWYCSKDEVGDYFCNKEYGPIQVQVIPAVGKRTDHFRVSLMPSVSTKEFSSAIAFIFNDKKDYAPIAVSNEPPSKIVDLTRDDVVCLADAAVSWAKSQSIEQGLEAYRNLPTDSKGASPLRHLAALAITGHCGQLTSYQCSFAQGDRLGFVPYITKEMIDRAVDLAKNKWKLKEPSSQ